MNRRMPLGLPKPSDKNKEVIFARIRTFIRWINHSLQLKSKSLKITNLDTDLEDGVILIQLLECLAPGEKAPGRYYAKPLIKIQKIQNVNVALRFITRVEKIPLSPQIKPQDILEKKEGPILSLIWSLILHYGIRYSPSPFVTEDGIVKDLKKFFLVWINCVLTGISITNCNRDWNDGCVLSALVNYFRPGSIPNKKLLKQRDSFARVNDAMDIAEKQLCVPRVVDVTDFISQNVDEYSVLLYLSYFIPHGMQVLQIWVKREVPEFTSKYFSQDWLDGRLLIALVNSLSGKDCSKIDGQASVEEGMLAAEKLLAIHKIVKIEEFASTTLSALARLGYLSQFYRVKKEGNIPVLIPPAAEKVDVGPIQIPRNVGEAQSVWLELDSKDAGYGSVHAEVQGKEVGDLEVTVEGILEKVGESTRYHVLFIPPKIDIYTLSIFYAKEHVTGSPFLVNLFPPDPNKVKHLETSPPKEGKSDLSMTFDTADAGDGKLKAHASGDIWGSVPIKVTLESNGEYILSFDPPHQDIYTIDVLWGKFSACVIGEQSGCIPLDVQDDRGKISQISFISPGVDLYTVDIDWDGNPIPGSPFVIDLLPPADPKAVECSLPIYTIPGEEAELLVDASKAGSGKLDAKCIGDKVGEVPVEINDLGERAYQVTFTPEEYDLYMLEVTYDDRKVRGSPFKIDMQPGVEKETGEIDEYDATGSSYVYTTTSRELDIETDAYTVDSLGETTEQEEYAEVKFVNIPAVLMRINLGGDVRDGEREPANMDISTMEEDIINQSIKEPIDVLPDELETSAQPTVHAFMIGAFFVLLLGMLTLTLIPYIFP